MSTAIVTDNRADSTPTPPRAIKRDFLHDYFDEYGHDVTYPRAVEHWRAAGHDIEIDGGYYYKERIKHRAALEPRDDPARRLEFLERFWDERGWDQTLASANAAWRAEGNETPIRSGYYYLHRKRRELTAAAGRDGTTRRAGRAAAAPFPDFAARAAGLDDDGRRDEAEVERQVRMENAAIDVEMQIDGAIETVIYAVARDEMEPERSHLVRQYLKKARRALFTCMLEDEG